MQAEILYHDELQSKCEEYLLQLVTEAQDVAIQEYEYLENMLVHMALKNTDCNQGSRLGSEDAISWANESDKSSSNPLLGQEDTLIGTPWWMECDFEEELSLKIEIYDGSHPSSRHTYENCRATEALLAEWHDIECTLGIIDSVQNEKVSHAGEELGDDARRVSLLSEWYLIEDSLWMLKVRWIA